MADKQVPPDVVSPSQQSGVQQQPTASATYLPMSPQQQMQYTIPQQPIVVQVTRVRTPPTRKENYNSALSKKLGIAQLVCGGLGLILNIIGIIIHGTAAYMYHDDFVYNPNNHQSVIGYYFNPTIAYYFSSGIWGMLSYSLSGSFALCAAHKKTKCTIITTMVFSIISSVCAFIMLCMACWAVGYDAHRLKLGFAYYVYSDYNSYSDRHLVIQKLLVKLQDCQRVVWHCLFYSWPSV